MVKVTWPRPAASRFLEKTTWMRGLTFSWPAAQDREWGEESVVHYCVAQGFRGLETMPSGWGPQWVRARDWEGENHHFLYMRKTQRNSSSHHGQESNQILFPFFGFKTSPHPHPPETSGKTKALPTGLHGEVQGSFPYGWLMNLIMAKQISITFIQ